MSTRFETQEDLTREEKAIKNAFYTLLGTVKKALTHNRCDSCGFTKEQVYVTEHFTESGWIECKPCYNNRSNSNCN